MKRPVYLLAGIAGMIGGALLVGWNFIHSAGAGAASGHPFNVQSSLVTGCAVAAVSACFLWLLLGPRK